MPALANYAAEGTLTINSVSFNTPAWSVGGDEDGEGSLLQLWGLMAERRGENRLVPAMSGFIAYPKRLAETDYSLRMIIIGDVNSSGVPYADDRVGLYTNLAAIRAVIDTVDDGTTGTVTASLVIPTGGPLTAAVQVMKLEHQRSSLSDNGKHGSFYEGTLQLKFPAGRLT